MPRWEHGLFRSRLMGVGTCWVNMPGRPQRSKIDQAWRAGDMLKRKEEKGGAIRPGQGKKFASAIKLRPAGGNGGGA